MPATVIYDGDCGLCNCIKDTFGALDWFRTMRWITLQSPEAAEFGISRADLEKSVYIVTAEGSTAHGWAAVKRILFRVPITYLAALAALRKSAWLALGIAVALSPAADPLGQTAYEVVSRNRYRFPRSTCSTPVWDNRENE